jgi:tetratricopeptide (TPR) repeat protein
VTFQARFFGAFALEDAQGRSVAPPLRKTRALLARILLARGEALPRSVLIEFAWKDREVEQGRASLRQALYEARALTSGQRPLIFASRTTMRANPAVLGSDLDRLIAAARGDDLGALALALGALGPNLPPLLADLDGISPAIDAWLAGVRQEKQSELVEAVSAAARRAQGSGRTLDGSLAQFLDDPAHEDRGLAGGPDPVSIAPRPAQRSRVRWLAGMAVLVLCAGLAAAWWLRPGAPHRVLAVEPLRAAAGDAAAQAVSLGLSGDLTHALVANPAGIVIDQVGEPGVRAADADLIVSGDVATLGDRLQAHVELANARGGAVLWANDFAGDPGHPDVVREQIATKADSVINCALSTRHGGAAQISDEANRLYLKACDLIEQFRLDEALLPLRQVTVLEPGFARAWADVATTEAFTAAPFDPARKAAAYREAAANARRALALDPRTGLAYYALAQVMPGIANWRRRVEVIADGLRVEPDGSELNNAMATELARVGRSGEAITYYRRSMAADPLNPVKTATLFGALAFDGQLDEAEPMIDRALQLWPRSSLIWQWAFSVELWVGDPKRAEAMLDAPDRPGLRDAKEAEEDRRWLRLRRDPTAKNTTAAVTRLLAASSADPRRDPLPAALKIATLGQTDAAYRLALGATGDVDEDNDEQLFHAGLTRFREDPRFMKLAARRGLLHIWQVTGVWPDFCARSEVRRAQLACPPALAGPG